MRRVANIGNGLISNPWALIAVAGAIVFGIWVVGTRSQPYHVNAAFNNAVSLSKGLDVQVNGVDVGKISSVKYEDGQAIVGLGISDKSIYPLHQGTKAIVRFGTTVGNGTRRIDLFPGPSSAPKIKNGGAIGTQYTQSAVEFDQIFNTFNAPTRKRMQGLFHHQAAAMDGVQKQINEGFKATPGGLEGTGGVMSDLASDQAALSGLVASTSKATRVLGQRQPVVEGLVQAMATTFDTFARHSRNLQRSIQGFAPTLSDTRSTLARLDTSVDTLQGLTTDLAPGAKRLRPLAATARPTLASLRDVLPTAVSTIRTGTKAGPDITNLLGQGTPFMPKLQSTLSSFSPMMACIRPYAPEIVGILATWAGWATNYDGISHYARVQYNNGPAGTLGTDTPMNAAQFLTLFPDMNYAFPRPPGQNVHQPWFIPECGITEKALDPTADPEAR